MAEWSTLQTGKPGDSGSTPAEVKTFFREIENIIQNIPHHLELN